MFLNLKSWTRKIPIYSFFLIGLFFYGHFYVPYDSKSLLNFQQNLALKYDLITLLTNSSKDYCDKSEISLMSSKSCSYFETQVQNIILYKRNTSIQIPIPNSQLSTPQKIQIIFQWKKTLDIHYQIFLENMDFDLKNRISNYDQELSNYFFKKNYFTEKTNHFVSLLRTTFVTSNPLFFGLNITLLIIIAPILEILLGPWIFLFIAFIIPLILNFFLSSFTHIPLEIFIGESTISYFFLGIYFCFYFKHLYTTNIIFPILSSTFIIPLFIVLPFILLSMEILHQYFSQTSIALNVSIFLFGIFSGLLLRLFIKLPFPFLYPKELEFYQKFSQTPLENPNERENLLKKSYQLNRNNLFTLKQISLLLIDRWRKNTLTNSQKALWTKSIQLYLKTLLRQRRYSEFFYFFSLLSTIYPAPLILKKISFMDKRLILSELEKRQEKNLLDNLQQSHYAKKNL